MYITFPLKLGLRLYFHNVDFNHVFFLPIKEKPTNSPMGGAQSWCYMHLAWSWVCGMYVKKNSFRDIDIKNQRSTSLKWTFKPWHPSLCVHDIKPTFITSVNVSIMTPKSLTFLSNETEKQPLPATKGDLWFRPINEQISMTCELVFTAHILASPLIS
jgi:hypothetical protein